MKGGSSNSALPVVEALEFLSPAVPLRMKSKPKAGCVNLPSTSKSPPSI